MKIVLLSKSNEVIKEIERGQHEVFDLVEYWDKLGNHNYYMPRSTSGDVNTIFYKAVSRIARIDERPRPASHISPNTA
jgi:hypothetical protein